MSAISRLRGTVKRMVGKYGATATLTRPVVSSVSTAGTPTMGTSLTTSTVVTFLPLSEYTDNREEQRTLAQRGVRYVVMDAAGMTLEPQSLDVLTVGGASYKVESSTPVDPGSQPIAHQALVVKL
jgi:hypothetical protein